ncbi:uncharacterized protein E0L32_011225 [Thyridium curvatum]|uniref:Uncharacterized protein n=1 Tax=Thyridium curvatum TaxID=1093900 RepID=A0A507BJN5_9PEZI|nr:uncharacterized protein E0L32_011225 [Thyridium curvatum]TPX19064.1 hypothetical protein E0L32_011225 [Thyridium curvatum]
MATINGYSAGTFDEPRPSFMATNKISRNLVRIPKKQRSILGQPSAWVDNQRNGSPDIFNLPDEVLEGLKRFEDSRSKHTPAQKPQISRASGPKPSQDDGLLKHATPKITDGPASKVSEAPSAYIPMPEQNNHGGDSDEDSEESDSNKDNGDNEEDAESAHTWESSPARVIIPHTETRKRASPEDSPSHERPAPLSPGRMGQNFACEEFESESDEEDEGENAAAHKETLKGIRHAPQPTSALDPTPPSAQVIPCTYHERSSPPGRPTKKRRKMKVLDLNVPVLTTKRSPDHPAHLRLIPNTRVEDVKSSNGNSQSSVIAETSQEQDHHDDIVVSATVRPNSTPSAMQVPKEVETISSSPEEGPEPATQASQYASGEVIHLPPFESFQHHYHAYTGSLNDFVRACFYVRALQNWKALPVFLYDDFIRAFTEGYIPYVNSPEQSSQGLSAIPLTGIKWYNGNVEKPLFNDRLIDKSNLDRILDIYREEVDELKESMGLPVEAEELADAEDVLSVDNQRGSASRDMEASSDQDNNAREEVDEPEGCQPTQDEDLLDDEDTRMQMEEQDQDEEMAEYRRYANDLHATVYKQQDRQTPIPRPDGRQDMEETPRSAPGYRQGVQVISGVRHETLADAAAAPSRPVMHKRPPSTARESVVSATIPSSSRTVPPSSSSKAPRLSPAERSKKWKKFLAKRKSGSAPSSARSSFGQP